MVLLLPSILVIQRRLSCSVSLFLAVLSIHVVIITLWKEQETFSWHHQYHHGVRREQEMLFGLLRFRTSNDAHNTNTTVPSPSSAKNRIQSRTTTTAVGGGSYPYPFNVPTNFTPGEDNDNHNLLLPLRIMEQYRQWHSDDALRNDYNNNDKRRFALGFYQCPLSAGNRLHEFMNDLLFAILTNRTLLWKYYDRETCLQHRKRLRRLKVKGKIPLKHCTEQNTIQDCNLLLHREAWIPSYDEWSSRLRLQDDEPVLLRGGNDSFAQGGPRVIIFSHLTNSLNLSEVVPTQSEWALSTSKSLFSLGVSFVYGMAFRYLFDLSDKIKATIPASHTVNPPWSTAFTVAVHSRHTDLLDDGCNVTRELQCLDQLIPDIATSGNSNNNNTTPCKVYAMADRECTLSSLRQNLEGKCTVHVAQHESDKGQHEEHGPFAGMGYFQDLVHASSATRHAVIVGNKGKDLIRSSSAFLLEMIEYKRVMEAWVEGKDPSTLPSLGLCNYMQKHSHRLGSWALLKNRTKK